MKINDLATYSAEQQFFRKMESVPCAVPALQIWGVCGVTRKTSSKDQPKQMGAKLLLLRLGVDRSNDVRWSVVLCKHRLHRHCSLMVHLIA